MCRQADDERKAKTGLRLQVGHYQPLRLAAKTGHRPQAAASSIRLVASISSQAKRSSKFGIRREHQKGIQGEIERQMLADPTLSSLRQKRSASKIDAKRFVSIFGAGFMWKFARK